MEEEVEAKGSFKGIIIMCLYCVVSQGVNYDEYREQAAKMAEKVSENAKILKGKAMDWFS